MIHSVSEPFLAPVDWKAWGLDDYPIIVKHPMDLSKVEVSASRNSNHIDIVVMLLALVFHGSCTGST